MGYITVGWLDPGRTGVSLIYFTLFAHIYKSTVKTKIKRFKEAGTDYKDTSPILLQKKCNSSKFQYVVDCGDGGRLFQREARLYFSEL